MAKGLRASSKVKARNARRYTQGSDYQVTHAARLHSISSRLLSRVYGTDSKEAKEAEGGEEKTDKGDAAEVDSPLAAMETEGESTAAASKDAPAEDGDAPVKKISTSGTRESRRETWRKARGWKPKTGSKTRGKPKRRG